MASACFVGHSTLEPTELCFMIKHIVHLGKCLHAFKIHILLWLWIMYARRISYKHYIFLNIECLHNIFSFFTSSLFSDVKRRCLWWWLFCSGGTAVPELVSDLVTVSSYYRSGRAEGMMLATLLLLAATTPRPDWLKDFLWTPSFRILPTLRRSFHFLIFRNNQFPIKHTHSAHKNQ